MSLEDLKLLADVAYHERHGQRGFALPHTGFGAARDRLLKARLIITDSTRTQVSLTQEGEELVFKMMRLA